MPDGLRPPYDTARGRTCSCMIAALPLLEYRLAKAGVIKQDLAGLVYQWTSRSDVSASAGTHKSGAVLDVDFRLVNTHAKLKVWLECGFVMFPRYRPTFDDFHGHGVVDGCPHLDGTAGDQIDSYHRGRDGLARQGPYPGPTNVQHRTWQEAQKVYAQLLEEMQMNAGDVWSHGLDKDGHDGRWFLNSIRSALLENIGPRTRAIKEDTDPLAEELVKLAAVNAALRTEIVELRADVKALTASHSEG